MGDTKYVAYTDLGEGSGAPVDPEVHGGEGSDNWKYLLEHGAVVPISDPSAAVVSDGAGAQHAAAAQQDEIDRLRARVKELEQAQKDAAKDEKASSSSSGSGGSSSSSSDSSSSTSASRSGSKSG